MAGSRAASTRPSRTSCWPCWTRRWPRTGRCATRARCWSCPSGARTAGSTVGRPAGWPTRRPAGRRCTGCSMMRCRRSWRCSTSGARPTGAIASWPTAARIWVGCGCHRRRCGGCCSWRTGTSGRCPNPAAASAGRSRTVGHVDLEPVDGDQSPFTQERAAGGTHRGAGRQHPDRPRDPPEQVGEHPGPNRFRAWVSVLDVGTDHALSQQPNLSSDPVTLGRDLGVVVVGGTTPTPTSGT